MNVPSLTGQQLSDLTKAIGGSASMGPRLAEQVEIATRYLLTTYGEPKDAALADQWRAAEARELERIAADPARALEVPPKNGAALHTWERLVEGARLVGIDPEARSGAIVIGDLARKQLSGKEGVNDRFRIGGEILLGQVSDCLRELAPWAFEPPSFPNNDKVARGDDEKWPAIEFARSFIEIVVDRTRERDAELSTRAEGWLHDLLNKKDRALLDCLRVERQKFQKHGNYGLEGGYPSEAISTRAAFLD